jgi:hypothetical protein
MYRDRNRNRNRNRIAPQIGIASQSLRSHFRTAEQSLRDRCATFGWMYRENDCNRIAIAAESLCSHFAVASESLRNRRIFGQ